MRRFPPPSRSRAFMVMTMRGCPPRRSGNSAPRAPVPGSLGVACQGDGQIPYRPEALASRRRNADHWIDRDPELKCYLPGIPRAMYMPYPFQITQSTNQDSHCYEFSNSGGRTIHLDKVEGPPDDAWMGHSVGRWKATRSSSEVTISTIGPGSTAPAIITATRCT